MEREALLSAIAARNVRLKRGPVGTLAPTGKESLGFQSPRAALLGVDEDNAGIHYRVTDASQDRDGDIVNPEGLDPSNWFKSPDWFFSHQLWPVSIGTGRNPQTQEIPWKSGPEGCECWCYFDKTDPDAMFVYGKVCRGFMQACSIGFIPLVAERLSKAASEDQPINGWYVERAELLEISVAGVASNRNALRLERGDRISTAFRKALEPFQQASKVFSFGQRGGRMSKKKPAAAAPVKKEPAANPPGVGLAGAIDKPKEEKASALDIQEVRCLKDAFPTLDEARKWVETAGYDAGTAMEKDDHFAFQQFPPDELLPDSHAEEEVAEGVKATVGQRATEQGHAPEDDKAMITKLTAEIEALQKQLAGKAVTKETEQPGGETSQSSGDSLDRSPPGVKMLRSVYGVCDIHGDQQEHPDMVDYRDAVKELTDERATMTYPDEDFSQFKSYKSMDDEGEDDEERGEQHSASSYLAAHQIRIKQRVSRAMQTCCAKTAEHLDGLSEHDGLDEVHKVACKYYAAELRKMFGAPLEINGTLEETSTEPPRKGKATESDEILTGLMEAKRRANARADELSRGMMSITGRG